MNKQKIIGIVVLVVLAVLIVSTGVVYATGLNHGGPPLNGIGEEDDFGPYWGPMHGHTGRWSREEDFPPMHDAVIQAVADATGLGIESIESRLAEGEGLIEIALDAGLEETEFFELMKEARKAYLTEAFEAGWISQARYEWLLERLEADTYGPGYGGCHRFEREGIQDWGGGSWRGRGRRW